MNSDALVCSICFSEYDSFTNPPRMLPFCGHTFCTACIERRLSETHDNFSCPVDRLVLDQQIKSIEAFPLNYALKQILETRSQVELCELHEKKLKIVCLQDKLKICSYCEKFGDHKNHSTKPMTEIISEASAKTKALQDGLNSLKEDCKNIEEFHIEEKQAFLGLVKDWFKELKELVENKEQESLEQVNKIFEAEGPRMREMVGFSSEHEKNVEEKIESLKRILKNLQGLNVLEDNEMEKSLKSAKEKLAEYKIDFTARLKNSSSCWNDNLQEVSQAIERMDFSLKTQEEKGRRSAFKEGKESYREDQKEIMRSDSLAI